MLDNNLPLYIAIAKDIKESIQNGTYSYQQLLPTETQLMRHYKVSRTTIRQAINQLVTDGLIKKIQGSGTYVTYRKDNELIKRSSNISPFSDEMREKGKSVTTKILSFEIIEASASIAEALEIPKGSKIYSFERLRLGNDFPLCLEHSYMPVAPYPDLNIQYLEDSKYKYIEQVKKKTIAYSHQNVSAIMSTERIEKLLQLKKYSPILKIQHTTFLDTGEILDLTTIYFSSDYYEAHFIKLRENPDV